MGDIATLNTYRDAAIAAIAAGDYATAQRNLMAAMVIVSAKANASSGGDGMQWRGAAQELQSLINQCNRMTTAAAGIRRTSIRYVRPGSSEDQ